MIFNFSRKLEKSRGDKGLAGEESWNKLQLEAAVFGSKFKVSIG